MTAGRPARPWGAWLAASTAVVASVALLLGVVLGAVHDSIGQIKQIRDDLRAHPPATQQDVDRIKTQVGDAVQGVQRHVQDGLAQVRDAARPPEVTVNAPPGGAGPTRVVVVAPPAATPRPTPSPRPSPSASPCPLAGLGLGAACPTRVMTVTRNPT